MFSDGKDEVNQSFPECGQRSIVRRQLKETVGACGVRVYWLVRCCWEIDAQNSAHAVLPRAAGHPILANIEPSDNFMWDCQTKMRFSFFTRTGRKFIVLNSENACKMSGLISLSTTRHRLPLYS